MQKAILNKRLALVAIGAESCAKLQALKLGRTWDVELSEGRRSRPQENFYRKLVRVVADGVGMPPALLHNELKYRAGKVVGNVDSPIFGRSVVLQSTADMEDTEFKEFVQVAEDLIFRDYLPGVERQSVHDEVAKLVDAAW